jgi:hypothetical protein
MSPRDLAEHEGKPIALGWIAESMRAIGEALQQGETSPLVRSALSTNFRSTDRATAYVVYTRLAAVKDILDASARFFHDADDAEAGRWFAADAIPPAYAIFDQGVWFTTRFAAFGPMCRAAMVLHESVHVFDRRSGEPEIHISEWDEPRFSQQSKEQALHNPSAYASLAAQIATGSLDWPPSARFGAGRPQN